jgi:alpha-galactosidase
MNGHLLSVAYSLLNSNRIIRLTFDSAGSNADVTLNIDQNGNEKIYTLYFGQEVRLREVNIKQNVRYDDDCRIYCNGYQSWTTSREYLKNERTRNLTFFGRILNKKYSLDRYNGHNFKLSKGTKGTFLSYTYTYIKDSKDTDKIRLWGSVSEKSGFTIYNHDTVKGIMMTEKECEGLTNIDKYYFTLYENEGTYDEVFDDYFKYVMDKKQGIAKPRIRYITDLKRQYTGFTSWYNCYQDIAARLIQKNLYYYLEKNPKGDIFQIDDGFQQYVGDWLKIDKKKFPNGMKKMADRIKKRGMIPGLWLAPFVVEKKSDLIKEHPDWLIKGKNNKPYKGGSNWSGFYALDLDNIDVKCYLRTVFDTVINEWGFRFLKMDFLYAECMLPGNNKTRGQLMCEAMDFLSDTCSNATLLGCGVPLGPAFGNVDFCRIGADMSLNWDNSVPMRAVVRERVSTRNSLVDTIFRRHLDGRAFLNDPDVFMIRTENCKLEHSEKEIVCDINNTFGSLLFTSDDLSEYGKEQMELFYKTIGGRQGYKDVIIDDESNIIVRYKNRKIIIPLKGSSKPIITYL